MGAKWTGRHGSADLRQRTVGGHSPLLPSVSGDLQLSVFWAEAKEARGQESCEGLPALASARRGPRAALAGTRAALGSGGALRLAHLSCAGAPPGRGCAPLGCVRAALPRPRPSRPAALPAARPPEPLPRRALRAPPEPPPPPRAPAVSALQPGERRSRERERGGERGGGERRAGAEPAEPSRTAAPAPAARAARGDAPAAPEPAPRAPRRPLAGARAAPGRRCPLGGRDAAGAWPPGPCHLPRGALSP